MKKSKTPIQDLINAIAGDSKNYHCSLCQKIPECIIKENGEMLHSSHCDTYRKRLEHDLICLAKTDCLVIYDSKTKKYSGRGWIGK